METKEQAKKRGKKSRADGKKFEVLVRKDLTEKGWIVCRWDNQVELLKLDEDKVINAFDKSEGVVNYEDVESLFSNGKLIQAKPKFNPFTMTMMMMSGGFPDFICFKQKFKPIPGGLDYQWDVQLIECKAGRGLDKEEKEKIEWIKNNLKIPVILATKEKESRKIKIVYTEQ